jgi:hypothetical protein
LLDKCPTCGHEKDAGFASTGGNSQRVVELKVPEHHWHVFKMMFDQMSVRFGMMGRGEFANLLPAYADQIPLDMDKFRYFDDVAVAYVYFGFERGYRLETSIEPGGRPDYNRVERMKVHAKLYPPDGGKVLSLQLSDCAYEDVAKEVCAYLQEVGDRLSPMSGLESGL